MSPHPAHPISTHSSLTQRRCRLRLTPRAWGAVCPLPSSRAASCKVPLLPGAPQLPPALHRAQSPWTRPADDSTFTASPPPRLSKACGELVTAPCQATSSGRDGTELLQEGRW